MPPLPIRPAPDPTPTLSTLARTLSDVRSYQLPRLRGCTSASLARDLADEARTDLESVRLGLEESRELCEALPESMREAVLGMWEGVEEEYLVARDEFRAALVISKRAMAAAARKHELLEPASAEDLPRAEPVVGAGGEDALQTKTNEVTDAMRRTAQLLQAELEKSVLSSQMLDESTRTLRTTHGLYDNYTALLTASGQLVRALERADWWDRILIMSALGFFLLCVAYVVKRRVVDRVGWLAVWWVGGSIRLFKMIFGGGKGAAGAAGTAGAAKEMVATVASVAGVARDGGDVARAAGTALSALAQESLEASAATAATVAASVAASIAAAASAAAAGSAGAPLGTPLAPRLALDDTPGLVPHDIVDREHGDEAHGGEESAMDGDGVENGDEVNVQKKKTRVMTRGDSDSPPLAAADQQAVGKDRDEL